MSAFLHNCFYTFMNSTFNHSCILQVMCVSLVTPQRINMTSTENLIKEHSSQDSVLSLYQSIYHLKDLKPWHLAPENSFTGCRSYRSPTPSLAVQKDSTVWHQGNPEKCPCPQGQSQERCSCVLQFLMDMWVRYQIQKLFHNR